MIDSKTQLRQFILEAVANDYEQFDSILNDVRKWSESGRGQFSSEDIRQELMRLIREGSMAAYELFSSSEPRPVAIAPQEISSAWFFILPAGKRELEQFSKGVATDRYGQKQMTV